MARRVRGQTPVGSCPLCWSWGLSYGSRSYCRGCYDFVRRYPPAQCAGCLRVIAVKKGHCRLCWLQAGIAAAGKPRITAADFVPMPCWQLSLTGMNRLGNTGPAADPTATTTEGAGSTGWTQLEVRGPGESRYFDAQHWVVSKIEGEALTRAWGIAGHLAETRGWKPRTVLETRRALAVVLVDHAPGDLIAWSSLSPALHSRDLSVTRTTEILALAGLLDDDRVASFTILKRDRLALLPKPMATDVEAWLQVRGEGGPRNVPRDEHTVRMNLNRVHPLLLQWAGQGYVHLREVTATDVVTATESLSSTSRRQTLTALRSLFGHCKKTGTIFNNPTRGIRDGQRPLIIVQPLQPAEINQAVAAATTPAARLTIALAAVHAARPRTIRELHLDDIDLGNRRLTINNTVRPLDDLTHGLLLAWLEYRTRRWPGTANPHLIINQQTAMTTRAVSENWLTNTCRGLTATLEALRVDRQLDEALTHDGDPLHLAALFGLDESTAIRYATIARQLLQTPAD
jgi:integrase